MSIPMDTIAHVVFALAGHAIDAIRTVCTAKSSADEYAYKYNRAKISKEIFEPIVREHERIRDRGDETSIGLRHAFEEVNNSLLLYEASVKKWSHRMGSDAIAETDEQYNELKEQDVDEKKKKKRKRIAPINRVRYVLAGKKELARCAERYEADEKHLGDKLTLLSVTFGHIDMPKYNLGGVPALIRFINLAKERVKTNYRLRIIEGADVSKYEYDRSIVDPNTTFSKISELAILQVDLRPKDNLAGAEGLEPYKNCIIVKRSGGDPNESLNLARLFAEDPADNFTKGYFTDPPDGAMLRCCAVFRKNSECDLLFRIPEGCSFQTLRQLLPMSGSTHQSASKAERVKLSIRLATSVLVVHSLGLVHKRILPETILLAQKQLHKLENPRRQGFPYLAAFQGARSDVGVTLKKSEIDAYIRRGIYFHPRDQSECEYREERYTMEDDIYSLGVCLFEIALWRSLLVFDDETNDYIYDDSFIPLSDENDWAGTTLKERAGAKLDLLVTEAKKRIPCILGDQFMEVVVACLTVGYESNPLSEAYDECRDEATDDPVAKKYLEIVLSKLRKIQNS